MVASNQILIYFPAEMAHLLNNLNVQRFALLIGWSIDSTKCLRAVHINPDLFETLLLLNICLPELVLLFE